jgi:hypothetical protein
MDLRRKTSEWGNYSEGITWGLSVTIHLRDCLPALPGQLSGCCVVTVVVVITGEWVGTIIGDNVDGESLVIGLPSPLIL